MRIQVNLASRPYIELRPVYSRLRTWMIILAVLGLALWFLYRNERGQAEEATARVTSVQNHVQELERRRQDYQLLMQQPKQASILRQSDFLNGLFRRKAFSWTATMTDLETVLPSGVQVLSIDPVVARDGHVTIRLRVTGSRDHALDLIRNLEKSEHFAAPRLASETLATNQGVQANAQTISTGGDVNFDILADYRPLPLPKKSEKPEETAKAQQPAASPAQKKAAPPAAHRRVKRRSPQR